MFASSDGVWSGSVAVRSGSSDNSPSSAYMSTGGQSENSLLAPELKLKKLSCLCLCKGREPVSVATVGSGWSVSGLLTRDLPVEWCLVAEGWVPVCPEDLGRFRSEWSWLVDWCLLAQESIPVRLGGGDLEDCWSMISWLMQRCRETFASAFWRWWIWSVSLKSELAGWLMLSSREAFTSALCRNRSIRPQLASWLMH